MPNQFTAPVTVTDTHKSCSFCKTLKPFEDFHKDRNNVKGKGTAFYCKACANEKTRQHHNKRVAENDLTYKRDKRTSYYKNMHGISLEDFEERLSKQNNQCGICKVYLNGRGQTTHLDHDHVTGKLRDILCTNCNQGLGQFKDNKDFLMAAIKYLQAHTDNGNQKGGSRQ